MAIAHRGLTIEVIGQGYRVKVSQYGNAVGLTLILDRGQFV